MVCPTTRVHCVRLKFRRFHNSAIGQSAIYNNFDRYGEQITAFAMFTILSCLNVINDSVTMAMGFSLPYVAEGYIAVKRIEKFMLRQFGLTSALFAKQDRRLKRKRCSTAVFRPESFRSGDTKLHSVSKTPTKIDTEKNGLSMVRVSASWADVKTGEL